LENKKSTLFSFYQLRLSILFAISAGVLAVLVFWQFELRSISRFTLLSLVFSAAVGVIAYYFLFRKSSQPFQPGIKPIAAAAFIAMITIIHLVPPQQPIFRYWFVVATGSISISILALFAHTFLMDRPGLPWNRIILVGAIISTLPGLLIIFFNGFSARIYADDFANILKLERLGWWQAGLLFYKTWSADFFSNFLVVGFSSKPWAPLLFLLLIQITLWLTLKQVFNRDDHMSTISTLAMSFILPLSVYTIATDFYKSIYWNASAMTLLPLLVMIPLYFFLMFKTYKEQQGHHWWILPLCGFLSFAVVTTHEVAAMGWFVLQAALLLWVFLSGGTGHGLRRFVLASAAGAAAGAAVLLASPGAAARISEQDFSFTLNIPDLFTRTFVHFVEFLTRIPRPMYAHHGSIRMGWIFLIGTFGLAWMSESSLQRNPKIAYLVLMTGIVMTAASFFPGPFILGGTIPMRSQFIPGLYLVLGAFGFGLFLPRNLDQKLVNYLSLLLLLVILTGSMINTTQLAHTIEPMRQYARDWDARDELVRTTDAIPRRLTVPWDEYEQNLGDFRKYYRSRE
jgi:hypothetical protein